MTALTPWQKAIAASIAAAHPLTPAARIRATGNHRAAANDEREPAEPEIGHMAMSGTAQSICERLAEMERN